MKTADSKDQGFILWLVEEFLPPDDEEGEAQPLSDRTTFMIGLALFLVVVLTGLVIR